MYNDCIDIHSMEAVSALEDLYAARPHRAPLLTEEQMVEMERDMFEGLILEAALAEHDLYEMSA